MKTGVTLLEVLAALALLGVLLALALPRLAFLHDRLAVEQGVDRLLNAHTRARLFAIAERRVTVLSLSADSIVIAVVEAATDTVVRWRGPGPAADGVSTTGLPRRVVFGSAGVTIGVANGSYEVARGAARRQVIVSRYGRIRVV